MSLPFPTLLPQLRARGVRPRKGLGQHFLTDPGILRGIVAAADLPDDAVVIEVGPGAGTLTAVLAATASNLIAVELDATLAPMLAELYHDQPHVRIVQADALQLRPADLLGPELAAGPYYLVANIPYYITGALLRHFIEAEHPPARTVLTVQLDVARRIVARPPQMSLLAVSVQVYARPTLVRRLAPGAFTPPPKVASAVIRLDPHPIPLLTLAERAFFFRVVRAGFGQKRKTLRNSLSAGLGRPADEIVAALRAAGLQERQRAQELDVGQWLVLVRCLRGQGDDPLAA